MEHDLYELELEKERIRAELEEQLQFASTTSVSLPKETAKDYERALGEKEDQIANLMEEKDYFISTLEKFARELNEAKEALQEEAELNREKNDLIEQLNNDNTQLAQDNSHLKEKVEAHERSKLGQPANGKGKAYLDVRNMVQVRGQHPKNSEVKSMDGNRESNLQQSRSTGNLKSQCGASSNNRHQLLTH